MKKIFIITCCLLLQACVSTAMTGASAVYNGYNIKKQVKNQEVSLQVNQHIQNNSRFRGSDIKVSSFNYEILLTGSTTSEILRKEAGTIASKAPYVTHVYNFIEIRSPCDTEQALQDDWITTRIKSKIIADEKMDASSVKVVTENGVVYLMGTLQHKDAKMVVDIARYTPGVKKVVKIFKYLIISKT